MKRRVRRPHTERRHAGESDPHHVADKFRVELDPFLVLVHDIIGRIRPQLAVRIPRRQHADGHPLDLLARVVPVERQLLLRVRVRRRHDNAFGLLDVARKTQPAGRDVKDDSGIARILLAWVVLVELRVRLANILPSSPTNGRGLGYVHFPFFRSTIRLLSEIPPSLRKTREF